MNRRKFITLVSAAAAWPLAPQFKGRYSTASIAFLASSTHSVTLPSSSLV
jgi:hypothetical protein